MVIICYRNDLAQVCASAAALYTKNTFHNIERIADAADGTRRKTGWQPGTTWRGRVMGIVVDSGSDVFTLTAEQIKPAPEIGAVNTDFLVGFGALGDRILILVDFDMLTSTPEVGLIEKLAA